MNEDNHNTKKAFLPKFQRRRDIDSSSSIMELEEFLKNNSSWSSKNAMCGCFDGNKFFSLHLKGIQNFLSFKQNASNNFWFSLNEGISLLFSRRLVICSFSENQCYQISAHQVLYEILSSGVSFHGIEQFCFFTRFGTSSRKPIRLNDSNTSNEDKPIQNIQQFSEEPVLYQDLLQSKKNIFPKYKTFDASNIFPPTLFAKVPQNKGYPPNACLSIENEDEIPKNRIDTPILYQLSRTTLVEFLDPPFDNHLFPQQQKKKQKKKRKKK